MKNQTSTIVAARTKRRRNSAITDTFQLLILGSGLIWLVLRGAAEMNYVWQWHRVPQYIYKVIDGELIFGPLIDCIGAFQTLPLAFGLAAVGRARQGHRRRFRHDAPAAARHRR